MEGKGQPWAGSWRRCWRSTRSRRAGAALRLRWLAAGKSPCCRCLPSCSESRTPSPPHEPAAGGSGDVVSHFTLECPPLPSLPTVPAGTAGSFVPRASGELGPLSVHTPVVWELLMFVGVSVSAVEQVLLSPSFSRAGVRGPCSPIVLSHGPGGREGGTVSNGGGN